MGDTDDAYTLVSSNRYPMEIVYADYANSMKAMANKARLEMVHTGKIAYDKNAARIYQDAVQSLNDKLNTALRNAPKERAAQRLANAEVASKKNAGLFADKGEEKKAAQRALTKYREEVGAVRRKDRNIKITDREWEAIQAGAISENKLRGILNNTDPDSLRQRATPRTTRSVSQAQANRIKAMSNSNYTLEQIADALNLPKSTISNYL